jgi:carbon monoxide dehydrogenase subunit G
MGCYCSTVVDAPVDEVWAVLRKFRDFSWASQVVTSVEGEGDPETVGATRVLNGAFHETLLELDDDAHRLRYSIDDGPGPVAKAQVQGYVGTVQVFSVTDSGRTFISWSSKWDSGGEGAQEFCTPIYQAALQALNAHFSG